DRIQHRQRTGPVGREIQNVEAQPLGDVFGALLVGLNGAFDERDKVADGLGGRYGARLHGAAPRGPETAAAGTQCGGGGVHASIVYAEGGGGSSAWRLLPRSARPAR